VQIRYLNLVGYLDKLKKKIIFLLGFRSVLEN